MVYDKELKKIIDVVEKEGGSDVHLSGGRHPIIRVAGELVPLAKYDVLSSDDTHELAKILLGAERSKRLLEERGVDFSYTTETGSRFRGNAYVQQGTVSVALRLIPAKIKTLEDLNLPALLEQFTGMTQGFFLVVGPVGHGKTTTLAALIEMVNQTRAEHILTIEDPIEYLFKPNKSIIDQREVGVDAKDFKTALRAMFRQDIDVAMIGEMRDAETMSSAVTAAETGHLVFSTLHTNNAPQTIDRIIDSFPPEQQDQVRAQLSQSLAGIFSQRLLPRISGGRIPAYELLINTTGVANLIREGRTHEIGVMIETGSGDGMIDMNRTLTDLVRRGEITPETARAYSMNPKGIERALR